MVHRTVKYFLTLLAFSSLFACHTLKPFTSSDKKKEKAIRHMLVLSQVKTSRLKLTYIAHSYFQGTRQSISGIIDITSDTSARITATSGFGLPLARITITQDSAFIHSMLFADMTVSNKSLLPPAGFTLSPRTLKDLFLGNLITLSDSISVDNYSLDLQNDTTAIFLFRVPDKTTPRFSELSNTVVFSLSQQKIVKNSFWFAGSDAQVIIDYTGFTYVNNKKVPNKLNFTIVQDTDTTIRANIKIKKIRMQ